MADASAVGDRKLKIKAPARADQRYRFVGSDGHMKLNLPASNGILHRSSELISPHHAHAYARETRCLTTPRGCLRVLTGTLMGLARKGDVEGFRAYVRSDAFLVAFNGLDANRRQAVMRCYARAEALCKDKASHPLVKPGPIDARRAQKVSWSDPAMRAKLAESYAVAGGNDEKAARLLGVSLGSARQAKKRHLDAGAIDGVDAM